MKSLAWSIAALSVLGSSRFHSLSAGMGEMVAILRGVDTSGGIPRPRSPGSRAHRNWRVRRAAGRK